MTARLRELAERWKSGDFEERECAEQLLAILDAEGDGGAVAVARLFRRREGVNRRAAPEFAARTMCEWDKPQGNEYWEYVQDLYAKPARSGGVSDADVDAACRAYIAADRFLLDGAVESMREPMRAALTHFAKGERHE